MTPEECAAFVRGDCQDPELRKKADREMDAQFAEAMKDPTFKAQWDAGLKTFADDIDDMVARAVYGTMK